mgnify:CR=1 FL=1
MPSAANILRNASSEYSVQKMRDSLDVLCSYFKLHPNSVPPEILDKLFYLFEGLDGLFDKLLTDSSNSGTPPSQDPNRSKKKRKKGKKKVGGQPGHKGHNLDHVSNPDEIVDIPIDQADLPPDKKCRKTDEYVARQVYDIRIERHIIEYRAEVWVDEDGKRYTARFPDDVKSFAQYGNNLKTLVLDLFVWQMLPFERTRQFFYNAFGIPISTAVIQNFNKTVYDFLLKTFQPWAKAHILESAVAYFDETFINVNGENAYLMTACTDKIILLEAFPDRSKKSIMEMGILPYYKGIAVTDCYAAYLSLIECIHVLCGVHLLRDLKAVEEKEGMNWAKLIRKFFLRLKGKVEDAGGCLDEEQLTKEIKYLERLIKKGYEEIEDKKEERTIKNHCVAISTKGSALLNRLVKRLENYIAFAVIKDAPFDNTVAERAFRMFKVWLKISGCFKSLENANIIALLRSYISTCQIQGIQVHDAIKLVLNHKLPDFMHDQVIVKNNDQKNNNEDVADLNSENNNSDNSLEQSACNINDNNVTELSIKNIDNVSASELNIQSINNNISESNIQTENNEHENNASLLNKIKNGAKAVANKVTNFFT